MPGQADYVSWQVRSSNEENAGLLTRVKLSERRWMRL